MKIIALLAAVALLAPVAFAQTTGRIDGRVVAESGDPLPGVTVQISSASLQGNRFAVTDAGGRFRFLGVPVGPYDLRATLEGFGMVEQPGIDVAIDRTVSLALTMTVAAGDEVTINGIGPSLDTTSTSVGASFDEELFSNLPTSRTFTGLAFAAPGVVPGGLGDNPSIGGASAAENRYVIDGLDTTDPAFGTIGTRLPEELVREVAIRTGGYGAEYGGALGGVLDVVTRGGGNELEGDVFFHFSDDSLQDSSPAVPSIGENLGSEEYDFGAALGGKLIEDRLWYFVAANPSYQNDFIATRGAYLEDTEELDRVFYSGKLSFQPDPDHQIVVSAFGDPSEGNDTIQNAYGRLGTTYEEGANSYGLTYHGTISSTFFVQAALGSYEEQIEEVPYDPGVPRYDVRDPAIYPFLEAHGADCGGSLAGHGQFTSFSWSPTCLGGTFQIDSNDRSRDELRVAGTWFASTGTIDHEVKVGGLVRSVESVDDASYPGRDLSPFVDSTGLVVDPTGLRGQRWLLYDGFSVLLEYEQESKGETDEQAIFLEDSIRIGDHFSLHLGVRADAFESTGSGLDGSASDTTANGLRRFLDFGFGDTVAPRLGFTWDVAENGRSKLYGHFGHFYESVPLDINLRAFGGEIVNVFSFRYPEDGSLPTASNPGEWFESHPLGVGTGISEDLEAMYTEEALVGFEYELLPNVAVGIKGTMREITNVIEDVSVDGGHTYFITNPGGTLTHNPTTGEELVAPVDFPVPTRDYEALELTLSKRFSNDWQLYGSAVYSQNEGNYGGLFRQDNGQLDPNITSLYDLPDLMIGAFGPLPNDREYQFKLYGSYLWPIGLTTGFYTQYLDGTPMSKLGAHPIYGADERFVVSRGSAGRTPDVRNLDVHLRYPVSLGSGNDLELIVDVFNVTGQQEAVTLDQTWTRASRDADGNPLPGLADDCGGPGTGEGTACPLGNPRWGTPTSYQAPRTIRLGARLSF